MENGLLKMQSSSRPYKADNVLFLDFNNFQKKLFALVSMGACPGFAKGLGL